MGKLDALNKEMRDALDLYMRYRNKLEDLNLRPLNKYLMDFIENQTDRKVVWVQKGMKELVGVLIHKAEASSVNCKT